MNQQQRNWTLTESPFLGHDDGSVVTSQPQSQTAARNGVVRVTEMLRQINNQEYNSHRRRESESEDERTDASISRRSSGADSGVGILSENELLEPDMDRPGSGAPSGEYSKNFRALLCLYNQLLGMNVIFLETLCNI